MEIIKTVSGRALSCSYNYFNNGTGSLFHIKERFMVHKRYFAARKGYRELAKKKKVKKVIEKKAWIPHNLRKKEGEGKSLPKRSLEESRPTATDDAWVSKHFAWRVFDFKDAVKCHRETHHPTMYNMPNALVNLFIELDMSTEKKTRFVEPFHKMAILPNVYEQDGLKERSVLVFCKTPEQKAEAQNAGANLVGGVEIIKQIEKGKVVLPDFNFIIGHPTILPELVTIRGLLKKKFPSIKSGTLGINLGELVTQFKNGVEYSCLRDEEERDYGWIETSIGRLPMDVTHLEENFKALLDNINLYRPKRSGPFITRVLMLSPPSGEKLKIDLKPHIHEDKLLEEESSDEEEDIAAKV